MQSWWAPKDLWILNGFQPDAQVIQPDNYQVIRVFQPGGFVKSEFIYIYIYIYINQRIVQALRTSNRFQSLIAPKRGIFSVGSLLFLWFTSRLRVFGSAYRLDAVGLLYSEVIESKSLVFSKANSLLRHSVFRGIVSICSTQPTALVEELFSLIFLA